jgi:hypothetical protein
VRSNAPAWGNRDAIAERSIMTMALADYRTLNMKKVEFTDVR